MRCADDELKGRQLFLWCNTDEEQFYTSATVISVTDNKFCNFRVDEDYGYDIEQQRLSVEAARKGIQAFEAFDNPNPKSLTKNPHSFEILKVINFRDNPTYKISGEFILHSGERDMPFWHNASATDTQMAYLWQDSDDKKWCLGRNHHEKLFCTGKAAAWAHEDQRWQVKFGEQTVNLDIVFRAVLIPPTQYDPGTPVLTHEDSSPASCSGGAAGGGAAASAPFSSPASTASAGAPDGDVKLELGQQIAALYPLGGNFEGFAYAKITKIDKNMVTYVYTGNTKLYKQSKTIKMDLAQAGRTAFLANSTVPLPPSDNRSFVSLRIFSSDDADLTGVYQQSNPKFFKNGKIACASHARREAGN